MLTPDERMKIWNEAHNQGLREALVAARKVEHRLAEEVKAGQTHYAWMAGANAVTHAIEMLSVDRVTFEESPLVGPMLTIPTADNAEVTTECNGHGRCFCAFAGCEHDKAGPCSCRQCKLDRVER